MGEITVARDKGKTIALISGALGVAILMTAGVSLWKKQPPPAPKTENIVPPPTVTISSVSALGRIEPLGEVIKVAAAPTPGGAKLKTLLVSQGTLVKKGDIIGYTTDYDQKLAELARAKKDLKVAQANLRIVKAGAKEGSISAQKATIARLQAELQGVKASDSALLARLQAQLEGEKIEKRATVERLKAERDKAEADYRRYRQLAEEGVIPQAQLETYQLNLETAEKRYREATAAYNKIITTLTEEIEQAKADAQKRINSLVNQIKAAEATLREISEVRDVDVALAQAEVERAMAVVKKAETDLELTVIRAPMDGEILEIKTYPGESINNQEGVVEMADTSQMMVVAEVYESDVGKVKIGQVAEIRSENNSFEGVITGKVFQISPKIAKKDILQTDPAASVDARVIEVKIKVDPQYTSLIKNLIYSQVLVNIKL
ncbi:MAG: HlyD family efflux transporter periplasmic adaptor subunit [Geminocystis sp.]|nr:HlyD family efflux transporter periplasmic adaptor subunit [Geminocystis sp.]MCS7148605.1 HlyD family efflux transporter periplasmic adaptor subunit [Geminocystis sp.]MDW8115003.1 HlyD family efflux transporter periplasmic adaptor subunit [Geminocystis sp.]MDW8464271.1 HlyD family efflux transporter periplasmic adaptor subunit [Geminocystis sp.]